MTKQGRGAAARAQEFYQLARKAHYEGNPDLCIYNLFPACEFSANVLREKMGKEPSERHEPKLESAGQAYAAGLITSREFKAYQRVYQLKTMAQYAPYYKPKKKKQNKTERITMEETAQLLEAVGDLIEKAKRYAAE